MLLCCAAGYHHGFSQQHYALSFRVFDITCYISPRIFVMSSICYGSLYFYCWIVKNDVLQEVGLVLFLHTCTHLYKSHTIYKRSNGYIPAVKFRQILTQQPEPFHTLPSQKNQQKYASAPVIKCCWRRNRRYERLEPVSFCHHGNS